MLSTLATCLAIDVYGPVCDNAGGIAEVGSLYFPLLLVAECVQAHARRAGCAGRDWHQMEGGRAPALRLSSRVKALPCRPLCRWARFSLKSPPAHALRKPAPYLVHRSRPPSPDVRAPPFGPREDGRPGRGRQHHRRHRQGLRHRFGLPGRPSALRRLCHPAQRHERRRHARRPARPNHVRRAAHRRHAAVLVLGAHHEVGRQGGQRHGHRDQTPVRRQPEPAHPQPPGPPRLRHLHQDLHRRIPRGGAQHAHTAVPCT